MNDISFALFCSVLVYKMQLKKLHTTQRNVMSIYIECRHKHTKKSM